MLSPMGTQELQEQPRPTRELKLDELALTGEGGIVCWCCHHCCHPCQDRQQDIIPHCSPWAAPQTNPKSPEA